MNLKEFELTILLMGFVRNPAEDYNEKNGKTSKHYNVQVYTKDKEGFYYDIDISIERKHKKIVKIYDRTCECLTNDYYSFEDALEYVQ